MINTSIRRQISASISLAKTNKGPRRETFSFDELPKARLDAAGKAATPLGPYKEYEKEHHAPSPGVLSEEEELYREAIRTGDIPDTALAKQVYLNWKRFPDCIVLTRVGKFYEVSQDYRVYPKAVLIISLTLLQRFAWHRYSI